MRGTDVPIGGKWARISGTGDESAVPVIDIEVCAATFFRRYRVGTHEIDQAMCFRIVGRQPM